MCRGQPDFKFWLSSDYQLSIRILLPCHVRRRRRALRNTMNFFSLCKVLPISLSRVPRRLGSSSRSILSVLPESLDDASYSETGWFSSSD